MSAPSILSIGNAGAILLGTVTSTAVNSGPVTSAPLMLDAFRVKDYTFFLGGTFTNFSVEIDGTGDANTSGYLGYANTPPNSNWFKLIAESDQSSTGSEYNPLTAVGQVLTWKNGGLKAVRYVASQLAMGTATGSCLIYGYAK